MTLLSCATADAEPSVLSSALTLKGEEAADEYLKDYYDSDSPKTLYNAAYSYIEAEDYESALSLLDEGIEKFPSYIRFLKAKAYIYRITEDNSGYRNTLKNIYDINPADIETAVLYLEELAKDDNPELAIEVAKDILRRDKNNQSALKVLSQYYAFYSIYVKETKNDAPLKEAEESSLPEPLPSDPYLD